MSSERSKGIRIAVIGGISTIIAAIFAAIITVSPQYSKLNDDLESAKEYAGSLEEEYRKLKQELVQNEQEKEILMTESNFQADIKEQNELLIEENASLKATIKELEDNLLIEESKLAESDLNFQEVQISYNELNEEYESLLSENASLKKSLETETVAIANNSVDSSYESTGSKVSLFGMDVFQNKSHWFKPGSSTAEIAKITDTYGNEYPKAHYAIHGSREKGKPTNPIYLLDYKYSKCEGQIAWSKWSMNGKGSVWIDFYSGDELIFSTDAITAVDEAIRFEFDVSNVKTLEIVCNGSTNIGNYIVYPYLNLIK